MFDFCRRLLESGDLATKLAEPEESDFQAGASNEDVAPPPLRPVRDPAIAMRGGVEKLPRPGELSAPEARARCLARFAHHELMAAEMFAWAILRWPEAPLAVRRGFLGILRDEQRHCRLYLDRLQAHGSRLEDHVLSDYFWKHAAAISSSPAGLAAFLTSMGLTFEQANLDFSPVYRDAFREAGDDASARVCEVVHRDETLHVRFAVRTLRQLAQAAGDEGVDDIALYERAVPFPLCAARAKGRRFDAQARAQAGLSDPFIEYVRTARSPQELRNHPGKPPRGAG